MINLGSTIQKMSINSITEMIEHQTDINGGELLEDASSGTAQPTASDDMLSARLLVHGKLLTEAQQQQQQQQQQNEQIQQQLQHRQSRQTTATITAASFVGSDQHIRDGVVEGADDDVDDYVANCELSTNYKTLSHNSMDDGQLLMVARSTTDDSSKNGGNTAGDSAGVGRDNSSVVMVRTMIDGLSSSPLAAKPPITTTTTMTNYQQVRQQPKHFQLLGGNSDAIIDSGIGDCCNGMLLQAEQQQQHRLSQSNSPVDFVGTEVTLADAFSTSSCSMGTHIISVKQEHKLILVNNNNNLRSNNNSSSNKSHHCDGGIMIDELSADGIEITLNQHHHHQQQHQQQQMFDSNNHEQQYDQRQQQYLQQQTGDTTPTVHLSSTKLQHHHHHEQQQQLEQEQQHEQLQAEQQQQLRQLQQHYQHNQNIVHHSTSSPPPNRLSQLNQQRHHHRQPEDYTRNQTEQQRLQHHHEALTVIVQPHEDSSHDSTNQTLSPELGAVVGDNSLETTTYQTLTSVVTERISPPAFASASSSYATLTPLQPLPPISTMSEKFAYGGHISIGGGASGSGGAVTASVDSVGSNSGGGGGIVGGGSSSNSNSSTGVSPFAILPPHHHHHNNQSNSGSSMGVLSLSSLGVQSPYPTVYDKLPMVSMTISMSPTPHSQYAASSPSSHTLAGIVVACDLQVASPTCCDGGGLSPQSPFSQSTDLNSPPPTLANVLSSGSAGVAGSHSVGGASQSRSGVHQHHHRQHQHHQHHQQALHQTPQYHSHKHQARHIICLSPVPIGSGTDDVMGVSAYESPYDVCHRDIMVNTTPNSSVGGTSGGGVEHCGSTTSPCRSVSLHSPDSGTAHALPAINSATLSTLSAASLADGGDINALQHNDVMSLTPSPPPTLTLNATAVGTTIDSASPILETQYKADVGVDRTTEAQLIIIQQPSPAAAQEQLQYPHHYSQTEQKASRLQQQQNVKQPLNVKQQLLSSSDDNCQEEEQRHLTGNNHSCNKNNNGYSGSSGSSGAAGSSGDMDEINTKELAQRISAELKRYSIPQAIFAQRVLCRSQGTLSDLLRNPKPWSKLKSGRETFRRMFKWLQEPEFQRMSALRMAAAQIPQRGSAATSAGATGPPAITSTPTVTAANSINDTAVNHYVTTAPTTAVQPPTASCIGRLDLDIAAAVNGSGSVYGLEQSAGNNSNGGNNETSSGAGGNIIGGSCRRQKDELHMEHMPQPKKPRLVFTDLQRRTLQAIFKETKRPSKEMQVTIARQLGLEPTTVGNFFMNARRRSMDKWRDDDNNKNQHNSADEGNAGNAENGQGNTQQQLQHKQQQHQMQQTRTYHATQQQLRQQRQQHQQQSQRQHQHQTRGSTNSNLCGLSDSGHVKGMGKRRRALYSHSDDLDDDDDYDGDVERVGDPSTMSLEMGHDAFDLGDEHAVEHDANEQEQQQLQYQQHRQHLNQSHHIVNSDIDFVVNENDTDENEDDDNDKNDEDDDDNDDEDDADLL